jgi:uncharacterized caspase-like protein/WD40 repeat protein
MSLRTLPFACLVMLLQGAGPALAQPPPQEPILRINPGMHTAPIRGMGVDAACALLATASDDKTVRLWRLADARLRPKAPKARPDGKTLRERLARLAERKRLHRRPLQPRDAKLLRTLRPPIGPGSDGRIDAVAVAPDGGWVAAGGQDAAEKALGGHFVYIFDVPTGAVVARLGPLGGSIDHLAVSPDGRYLAAALAGGRGLRVWESTGSGGAGWRLAAEDSDYGGQSASGAAFDRAGALYTVAYDGKLRRYAPGFRGTPRSMATRGGRRPMSVAVHPSGDTVAVGYLDTTAVDIHKAATLAWSFAADTGKAVRGNLGRVAWSADGTRLYAGGRFDKGGINPIVAWDRAGRGRARELEGPQSTITQLVPCGIGIALGASDPLFGLLAPDGRRVIWKEGVQADLRGQRGAEGFTVAGDGRRVRFRLEQSGGRPILFDLAAEDIIGGKKPPADLDAPDTTSLPVTDWVNSRSPKLGGTLLALEGTSRSLAIAPDRRRFVLGTEGALRAYDNTGKLLWRRDAPGVAWAVNIPRNANIVLAGYGDGTIRWHRLDDGRELLALFVHKWERRWVAWTPRGYYMASPGAESMIGWHVNHSWTEAAQFFPADRFRGRFNRPDIVKLVLETQDEDKAVEAANGRAKITRAEEDVRKLAPPIVVIEEPGDGATFRTPEVTIRYNVFSPSGGKTPPNVQYFVNNAAVRSAAELPADTGKFTFSGKATLPLPSTDVLITLVAHEGSGASEPARISLRWDGAQPGKEGLKRLRALFVGVNAYASPKLNPLKYAAKDAADLAAFFKAQEGRSYGKVEARVLADAGRADVINGLEWLQRGSEEGDVSLLFLAGHGTSDERRQFYFMAADSDPDALRATAVATRELLETIRNLKGTRIVILDACRSGAGADGVVVAASSVDMNRVPNELGDKSLGVLLYASAQGRQVSFEHRDWGNGAFTKALIEGLGGKADSAGLGYVESDALSFYVRHRVEELTGKMGTQVPVHLNTAPQMKLVVLKK